MRLSAPLLVFTDIVVEMALLLLVDGKSPDFPFRPPLTSLQEGGSRGTLLLLDGGEVTDSPVVSSDMRGRGLITGWQG